MLDYRQPVDTSDRSWVLVGVVIIISILSLAVVIHPSAGRLTSACDRGESFTNECALEQALRQFASGSPSSVQLSYLRTAQEEFLKEMLGRFDGNMNVVAMAPADTLELDLWLEAVDGELEFSEQMTVEEENGAIRVYDEDTLVAIFRDGWMRVFTRYVGIHDASVTRDCRRMGITKFSIKRAFDCPLAGVELRRFIGDTLVARQTNHLALVLTDWEEVVLADLVAVP